MKMEICELDHMYSVLCLIELCPYIKVQDCALQLLDFSTEAGTAGLRHKFTMCPRLLLPCLTGS